MRFVCWVCGEEFDDEGFFAEHLEVAHGINPQREMEETVEGDCGAMEERVERIERRHLGLFCHRCGKPTPCAVEVYAPCPYCGVDVRILLCPECARRLAAGILRALEGGEGA